MGGIAKTVLYHGAGKCQLSAKSVRQFPAERDAGLVLRSASRYYDNIFLLKALFLLKQFRAENLNR